MLFLCHDWFWNGKKRKKELFNPNISDKIQQPYKEQLYTVL